MGVELTKKLLVWLLVLILTAPAGAAAQDTGQTGEMK